MRAEEATIRRANRSHGTVIIVGVVGLPVSVKRVRLSILTVYLLIPCLDVLKC